MEVNQELSSVKKIYQLALLRQRDSHICILHGSIVDRPQELKGTQLRQKSMPHLPLDKDSFFFQLYIYKKVVSDPTFIE